MTPETLANASPLSITIESENTPLLCLNVQTYNALPAYQRRRIAGQNHICKLGKWHRVRFRPATACGYGQPETVPAPFAPVEEVAQQAA